MIRNLADDQKLYNLLVVLDIKNQFLYNADLVYII